MTSKIEELALQRMGNVGRTELTLQDLVLMILRKRADDEALRRGLLADSHHPVHPIDRAEVPLRPEMKPDTGRGWSEPIPDRRSQTNERAFERMMKQQDDLDRAALIESLAKTKNGKLP